MGWKSTVDITRKEAISLVFARLSDVHNLSDNELAALVELLGYGDNTELSYYGYNFNVSDNSSKD